MSTSLCKTMFNTSFSLYSNSTILVCIAIGIHGQGAYKRSVDPARSLTLYKDFPLYLIMSDHPTNSGSTPRDDMLAAGGLFQTFADPDRRHEDLVEENSTGLSNSSQSITQSHEPAQLLVKKARAESDKTLIICQLHNQTSVMDLLHRIFGLPREFVRRYPYPVLKVPSITTAKAPIVIRVVLDWEIGSEAEFKRLIDHLKAWFENRAARYAMRCTPPERLGEREVLGVPEHFFCYGISS